MDVFSVKRDVPCLLCWELSITTVLMGPDVPLILLFLLYQWSILKMIIQWLSHLPDIIKLGSKCQRYVSSLWVEKDMRLQVFDATLDPVDQGTYPLMRSTLKETQNKLYGSQVLQIPPGCCDPASLWATVPNVTLTWCPGCCTSFRGLEGVLSADSFLR